MTLKICLAGSGGGHVRQLLDLEPAWARHDVFFVTEPTALGQSLPGIKDVEFVEHYSFGQAKLGNPVKMLLGAWRNLRQSFTAVRKHRPDVVITSGAGAVFAAALIAKWHGAEVIAIESFARFDHPSLFGRIVAPFADTQIIQSAALAEAYPKALVFEPFKRLDGPRPEKQALIFATVGATLGFPRLVENVVALKRSGRIKQRVVLQTGPGGRIDGIDPHDLEQVETLPFDDVKTLLKDAEIVITHGGTGSLITAMREGCHVIAMPRRHALKEHYDDHQEQIVSAFSRRGLLQQAHDAEGLVEAIEQTGSRDHVMATSDPQALISWLGNRLSQLESEKAK